MKKLGILTIAAALTILIGIVSASIIPLFTYTGDVLPSAEGWTVSSPTYEAIAAQIEDGVLHITDSHTYIGSTNNYRREWEVTPGYVNVAEFDVKLVSADGPVGSHPSFPGLSSMILYTSDGNYDMAYHLLRDKILSAYDVGFGGPTVWGKIYKFDTTTAFNTYKAVIVNGTAKLYINGELVLEQPAGTVAPYGKTVRFGASHSRGTGEAYFDEIRAYQVPAGLISHWNFDEGSGVVTGDSIGTNDGAIQGGASWTNGVSGKALSFDGVDDFVEVPDDSSLSFGDSNSDSPFTFSAWIKRAEVNRSDIILSKYNSYHGYPSYNDMWQEYSFDVTSDNRLIVILFDTNGPNGVDRRIGVKTIETIDNQCWYHVVATYEGNSDANGLKLYINGEVQPVIIERNDAGYIAMHDTPESFKIGATRPRTGLTHTVKGEIDEVKVYNRVLLPEEIKAQYEEGDVNAPCGDVPATIDIDPDTLNLKSNGKWITAYIELPEGYDVADINVSTVLLNDTISAELRPSNIGDYDRDDILDLMVKFDRADVIDLVKARNSDLPPDVELTVTGSLTDGTQFEGTDTIRVIEKGRHMMWKRR